jgi:hypothetical protein
MSPFSYARNNPIVLTDMNGDTVVFADPALQRMHEAYYTQTDQYGNYANLVYQSQYDFLNASDITYCVTSGDLGGNQDEGVITLGDFGTQDGQTVNVTLDLNRGATMDELSHEFVHGLQFEQGRISFGRNNEKESWGTVGMTLGLEDEAFRNQQNPRSTTMEDLKVLYPRLVGKNPYPLPNSGTKREVWRTPILFGVSSPKK